MNRVMAYKVESKRVGPALWTGACVALALLAGCARTAPPKLAEAPGIDRADAPAVATQSVFGDYLAGQFAQHDHDYGAAAEYLGRALAVEPDNLDLQRRTFLLLVSEGKMDRALPLAQRLSGRGVSNDAGIGLADLVLLVEHVKAGDDAAPAAARLPDEGLLRFATPMIVAWTDIGDHDLNGALKALDRFDKMQGFESLKALHSALIDDFAGQDAAASGLYKKMLTGDRLNWRVVDMAGNFYERHNRVGDAKALYERFAQENADTASLVEPSLARIAAGQVPPPRIAGIKDGLAEALFDVASLLNQRETQDLALLYGRLSLELKPNLALAQMLVAEIAEGQDRFDEALAEYRAVEPDSPFSWIARLRSAEVLDNLGRSGEAAAELKSLAADRANSSQPLIELGDMLRGHNQFPEAVTAYDGAIARIGSVAPEHWSVFYSRGIALERSGQWPRAEADFLHALELQPDQPLVLNYLGYSWIEKGQHLDRALTMIQRAVELRPDDGYIVDSLGWAFYQVGKYPEATKFLERAIELLPQDPTINDHLGDAYWQSGRYAEARFQWRRALQFSPEPDEIKDLEAKLDKGLVRPGAVSSAGGG